MKKRIVPALLACVLLLSLMPVAFAAPMPMTLVQETTGDPSKEFVYYIGVTSGGFIMHADELENVELITTGYKRCIGCGFTVLSCQNSGNVNSIFTAHSLGCEKGGRSAYDLQYKLYKVKLKDGEKISFYAVDVNNAHIFAEQESGYSLSYTTNGVNFTNFVNDGSIYLSETTVADIKFTPVSNGTLTIRRSDGSAPDYAGTNDNGTSFPDVPQNADYFTAVEYVNKLGIMVGDEKGNFNPDKIVSRAEMATIVCRVLGQADNLPKTNVFPDVPMAYWGNACIGKAAELKIVNGYPGGKFGPDDPVTYEQAVTMIVRAIGAEDEANSNGGYPNGYWYVANQKNLLKGVTYLWGQGMPRNAVAVLVYNYYTAAPEVGHTHDWATRHVDEVGHYEESSGTHRVMFKRCDCGFEVNSDTPNVNEVWTAHTISCRKTFIYWYEDVPNDSQYVMDTPVHDEIYCTICGATK